MDGGAHGLVQNGKAIQVIVGLSVPQVRSRFEALLQSGDASEDSDRLEDTKAPALVAFADGQLMPITEVPDEGFASKAMGDGCAILPSRGVITAPAAGEVMMVMEETGHAIGLKLPTGMEILLHIGIDTVNMQGDGFKVLVKAGDTVEAGGS